MHQVHALAVRRVAFMAAAGSATLAAHAVAAGGMHLTAAAPPLWAVALMGALVCGGRRRFAPRSFTHTLALLGLLQTALHLILVWAPGMLGVAHHWHEGPALGPLALAVHAAAALALAVLLRGADRVLAAAVAAVRALLRSVRRSSAPPRAARPGVRAAVAISRVGHDPRSSRGPPAVRLLPAGVP